MAEIIQDDLNITLNTITQTVLDITCDYVVSSQVLKRINTDLEFSMTTSVIYHVIDEVIYKAVLDKIREYIRDVPLVGKWISHKLLDINRRPYIRALIQIVTILLIQKTSGQIDVIELTIIMLNTKFIDYVTEIEVISDVLDKKFDM